MPFKTYALSPFIYIIFFTKKRRNAQVTNLLSFYLRGAVAKLLIIPKRFFK